MMKLLASVLAWWLILPIAVLFVIVGPMFPLPAALVLFVLIVWKGHLLRREP